TRRCRATAPGPVVARPPGPSLLPRATGSSDRDSEPDAVRAAKQLDRFLTKVRNPISSRSRPPMIPEILDCFSQGLFGGSRAETQLTSGFLATDVHLVASHLHPFEGNDRLSPQDGS